MRPPLAIVASLGQVSQAAETIRPTGAHDTARQQTARFLPRFQIPSRRYRNNRSSQVFGLGGSKPSSIQISYGHFAMDVRKCLPSGCRLNPAMLAVYTGKSSG